MDIIGYYMDKKMEIDFFSEATEKVMKLGKLPDPTVK